jgi:pyruvate formate lyase activating enzyme
MRGVRRFRFLSRGARWATIGRMQEARYWEPLPDGRVRCLLCPHRCEIADGHAGRCRVREAAAGRLVAAGYGLISSAHVDPIEKKPLHHFLPGSSIFSIGGWGCNFACAFCQNWTISQDRQEGVRYTPADIVGQGARDGSVGIAYTYNEPVTGFEFVLDCARLARSQGLANVLVTNGFLNPEPAAELLPWVDAANVDIKSMDEAFYRRQCRGSLQPVLDFCCQARQAGCHLEITNLVIPGLNDGEESLARLARWIAERLGRDTPLHLSAYYPRYKSDAPPTSVSTLDRAFRVCADVLDHVFVGNADPGVGRDSVCRGCGAVLIERRGYRVRLKALSGSACSACGRESGIVVRVGPGCGHGEPTRN